jgi:hypothetical protein
MRYPAILIGACVIGTSGAALGNPVMVINESYAQQYPGTSHVQLTHLYSYGSMSTMEITRDEQVVSATIESTSAGSRDLGSGVSTIYALVACDCNVPVGHHSYGVAGIAVEVEVVDASSTNGVFPNPSAECDQACEEDVFVPPQGGSGGEGAGTGGADGGCAGSSGAAGEAASAGLSGAAPAGGQGGTGSADAPTKVPPTGGSDQATGGNATLEEGGGGTHTGGATATGGHSEDPLPATGGASTSGGGGTHTGGATATGGSSVHTGGATATGGAATSEQPARKKRDSSGCAMAPARGTLTPLGMLAALGLLARRRRK